MSHALRELSALITEEMRAFDEAYARQFHVSSRSIRPLFVHIQEQRGKRIRPMLFFLCQGLFGNPNPSSAGVAVILELLHLASLLHDDVVDGSLVRRGRDTVNAVWDNRVAVLLGDFLMARILKLGLEVQWKETLGIVSSVVERMAFGELNQTMNYSKTIPGRQSYLNLIDDKTAVLFAASSELSGLVAGTSMETRERLRVFGRAFGLVFQIRDDILDIIGNGEVLGKPTGQDFFTGHGTLPFLLSMERATTKEIETVNRHLEKAGADSIAWMRGFIEEKGGVLLAGEEAAAIACEAESILGGFPDTRYRAGLLQLLQFGLERLA